jgi:hypothetical protein
MRKGWMRAALAFGVTGAAVVTMAGPAFATTVSAANDSATTTAGQPVTINVAANDTISDGATKITVQAPGSTANGTNTASGSTITYTPNAGFTGTDSFEYDICATFPGDYGSGDTKECDSATVTVTVGADTSQEGVPQDPYGGGDVGSEGTGTSGSGGSLPHTGAGDAPLALLAFALVGGGFACYFAARDRSRAVVR